MVRDTLLGFPSHSLPYLYCQSCRFIDSLGRDAGRIAGAPAFFVDRNDPIGYNGKNQ